MVLSIEDYKKLFVDTARLFTEAEFDKVSTAAQHTQRPLDQLLMEASFITPEQFLQLLSEHFGVPYTELKISDVDLDAIHSLSEDFAVNNLVMVFGKKENEYQVAMVNPGDQELLAKTSQLLGTSFKAYVTTELAIRRALVLYNGDLKQRVQQLVDKLAAKADGAEPGVIQASEVEPIVENIIEAGVLMAASDIHIEPYETEIIVRFRLDGLLQNIVSVPVSVRETIAAIIKVESNLKLDQKRLPQDGRFTVYIKGQEVNVRVSIVPSMWGEKVVLRILPKETHLFNISNLGMLEHDLATLKTYLQKPHGMILVTGPTNSGKSTSLYAFLQQIGIDRMEIVNISTIEDPIEYTIPRVTQIQVDPGIDLTFTSGLRALLRQDPDIIMVGEIRDGETAEFATQAALVGRLVLSSLHTNDAPATIPRLLDMGIEPYLVASTLSLIVAQRLARKLCEHCRQSYVIDEATLQELHQEHDMERALQILQREGVINSADTADLRFYRGVGCNRCNNTGYQGRIGLFEIFPISPTIQAAINRRSDSNTLREQALQEGMKTMFEDGLAKIILGQLDLAELLRVVYA